MSAEQQLLDALRLALGGVAGLNGVFVREPPRGAEPFLVIDPVLTGEWGTKDRRGRELRIGWRVIDRGAEPEAAEALAEAAEAATLALPRDLTGWRIAGIVTLRGRLGPAGGGWEAAREFRVRMMEEL